MDCTLTQQELVRFHFGGLEASERDELEAHLAACSSCLGSFFALKRTIEETERPSASARSRLRAAVAAEVATRAEADRVWWQPPVAFAMAVVATLLAVVAVESLATLAVEHPQIATAARVDR
jgi:anti-sigma factor RsiW